jgi:Flp pilus assembly protein TadB
MIKKTAEEFYQLVGAPFQEVRCKEPSFAEESRKTSLLRDVIEPKVGTEPATSAQIAETKTEAEAEELAKAEAKPEMDAAEQDLSESASLATAIILPLGLLSTKKAWVWIVVLICVAIVVYLLLSWYSRKRQVTSLSKDTAKTSSGYPFRGFL